MPEAGDGRDDRAALGVLLVVIIGAFGWYLWLARRAWFVADEWDFLTQRSATSLRDLFRPHNEHWSTVPILLWRALFQIFGVRTYVPYLLLVLVAHLALAGLLWLVMRRAEVHPWIATAAAALFVLFGSGYDDILWAFQFGFTAALVFGVTQLLLADHDGPVDRRDYLAVASGLIGLMCSGVAVTMTVVVGIAVLARRGWRPALLQTVPLAAVYLLWFSLIGHEGYGRRAALTSVPSFAFHQVSGTFHALGQLPGLGVILAVVLAIGLVMVARRTPMAELRRRAAAAVAMLVGSIVFATLTAFGRAEGPNLLGFRAPVSPSRYEYVLAALILPALALAVSTIAELKPRWGLVLAALFLVPIPGNVRTVVRREDVTGPLMQNSRQAVVAIASLPLAHELPRSQLAPGAYFSTATIGWLLAAKAAGRLPSQPPLPPAKANALTQALVVQGVARPPSTQGCTTVTTPIELGLARGAEIVSAPGHAVEVTYLPTSGPAPPPVLVGDNALSYPAVEVLVSSLRFRIAPQAGGTARLCR